MNIALYCQLVPEWGTLVKYGHLLLITAQRGLMPRKARIDAPGALHHFFSPSAVSKSAIRGRSDELSAQMEKKLLFQYDLIARHNP